MPTDLFSRVRWLWPVGFRDVVRAYVRTYSEKVVLLSFAVAFAASLVVRK